jgi:hypothetical protein
MLVDSLNNPELSRFLRELLARSSLMVSTFEPARLLLCGVDEHAAIATALGEGMAKRPSLSPESIFIISRKDWRMDWLNVPRYQSKMRCPRARIGWRRSRPLGPMRVADR